MGDGPDSLDDPKFAELRKQFLEEKLYQWQPTLNSIEDANWGKPVHIAINDTRWEFRKLTHAEITMLTGLPYFPKLIAQEKLTDAETKEWANTRKTMTANLCAEPNRWLNFVATSPEWADVVFGNLMKASMVDVVKLGEFFKTDYGFNYGFLWFWVMRKTPTEVGAISEGDYQAVSAWFREYNERVKKP